MYALSSILMFVSNASSRRLLVQRLAATSRPLQNDDYEQHLGLSAWTIGGINNLSIDTDDLNLSGSISVLDDSEMSTGSSVNSHDSIPQDQSLGQEVDVAVKADVQKRFEELERMIRESEKVSEQLQSETDAETHVSEKELDSFQEAKQRTEVQNNAQYDEDATMLFDVSDPAFAHLRAEEKHDVGGPIILPTKVRPTMAHTV